MNNEPNGLQKPDNCQKQIVIAARGRITADAVVNRWFGFWEARTIHKGRLYTRDAPVPADALRKLETATGETYL